MLLNIDLTSVPRAGNSLEFLVFHAICLSRFKIKLQWMTQLAWIYCVLLLGEGGADERSSILHSAQTDTPFHSCLKKIRLKFSIEDVWSFVSGLQLGNLKEWDCPRGETPENITVGCPFKQPVCGGKGWEGEGWSPPGQELLLEEERLPQPLPTLADRMPCCACC